MGDTYALQFTFQAVKLVMAVSNIIVLLDRPAELRAYLRQIGAMHCQYQDRGFEPTLFKLFEDAIYVRLYMRLCS